MNDGAMRVAAEERLFDAELADVLEVPVVRVAAVAERAQRPRWLVAAVVLLGLAVTAFVAFERPRRDAAQQAEGLEPPCPLPIPWAIRPADLAKLPLDSRNLGCSWHADEVPDFDVLTRFESLERVQLQWSAMTGEVPVEVFRPLAALPRLEVLLTAVPEKATAAHLAVLAELPRLRFLTLFLDRPLSADDCAALARAEHLVALQLFGGAIDAAAVRALARLPRLEVLGLRGPRGATPTALRELRGLHGLRRLEISALHWQPRALAIRGVVAEGNVGFTPELARTLAELPLLEEVRVEDCAVTAEAIACLPARLTGFALTRCPEAGPDIVAAIARFGGLKRLELDRPEQGDRPASRRGAEASEKDRALFEAQAHLLGTLPIRTLVYLGPMPRAVLAVLPRMAEVRRVECEHGFAADLAAFAQAPKLETLRLTSCGVQVGELAPLAASKSLRRVELRWTCLGETAAVRTQLPGVTVTDD